MAGGWWATLEAVSYRGVGLLLTVLWQSSILFAGVGVLSLVLRRSRAAARHALWTIAVFLAPLLPGLTSLVSSVGAPSARIEVLPRPPARQIEASSSRTSPATPTPAASTPLRGEAGSGTHSTSLMCPVGLPWSFAFAGYLVGAALLLSLVELGRLRLAIWVRQAEGTADPRVLNAFRSAQSAVRLRRAIRVAESLRAPTPLTIGSFRPVVLLPQGIAETTRCILESLALCYRHGLDQLAEILDRSFSVLHIVGGGSQNTLLCQFAANATRLPVSAGPVEATAAGNVLVQALALGHVGAPQAIRDMVRQSFTLVEYEPRETRQWEDRYGRYIDLVERKES